MQNSPAPMPARRHPWLWALALLVMLASALYQRATGPTHPQRVRAELGGKFHTFRLVRSENTDRDARVVLPELGPGVAGRLVFRRFPTEEPWTATALRPEPPGWAASLPRQPAAGKLEYHLELETPEGPKRIPGRGEVRLRFKDPVPAPLLVAHVACMFFGVLFGLRTGLEALVGGRRLARLAWETLALLTAGGLVLGPLVQKAAFGAYWTGWPWGYDLTDNKTLLMWLVWLAAGLVLLKHRGRAGRWAAGLAALAMAAVYVIPHSTRGSQLDYARVQRGVDPRQAVGTGR